LLEAPGEAASDDVKAHEVTAKALGEDTENLGEEEAAATEDTKAAEDAEHEDPRSGATAGGEAAKVAGDAGAKEEAVLDGSADATAEATAEEIAAEATAAEVARIGDEAELEHAGAPHGGGNELGGGAATKPSLRTKASQSSTEPVKTTTEHRGAAAADAAGDEAEAEPEESATPEEREATAAEPAGDIEEAGCKVLPLDGGNAVHKGLAAAAEAPPHDGEPAGALQKARSLF
jgi:hypothetical protein